MTAYSKFARITTSCQDYVHPYTDSCLDATAGLFLHAVQASFRIYVTAYVVCIFQRKKYFLNCNGFLTLY